VGKSNPIAAVTAPLTVATSGVFGKKYNPFDSDFDPLGTRAARRAARTEADMTKDAILAQEAELKKKKNEEANNASNLALRNMARMRRRDSAPYNRSGTILTSPLGVPNQAGSGQRTLLGQ